MVRFSCFLTRNLHKTAKKVQHPGDSMHSTLWQKSEDQERRVNFDSASTSPEAVDNNLSNTSMEQTVSPSSHGDCWKSEYLNMEDSKEFLQIQHKQKAKSLGRIVDIERGSSGVDVTDDEKVDQQFSYKNSHEKSTYRINSSHAGNTLPEVHRDSIFLIEVLKPFDVNQHDYADEQSTDHIADSGCLSSDNHTSFARSHSAVNLRMHTAKYTEGIEPHKMRPQSRSFESLHSLDGGVVDIHDVDDVHSPIHLNSYNFPEEYDEGRKNSPCQTDLAKSDKSAGLINGQKIIERFDSDNQTNIDVFHSHDNFTSGNEGEEHETDEEETKNLQLVTPVQNLLELNPKEYNIRRIEEWISQIDNESGFIVEEPGESSCSFSRPEPQVEVTILAKKCDARSNLGMEVANDYISSLTATSSSAHMVNLGLVAVPFLSAFTSLRVLNLSGNFIVRIAAGSLPRGLHMLNLSKNNIAIIESLRDLTHLRVLDLSYNRLVRIGHGLASCSSLKELYLAGNKISYVEGLHRLLKLNVLDLRGNKISTAKGLGQLAANYSSLQSINLEGNPAQRNVGHEQLKKYVLTLLPNLIYYNKQSIKAGGAKEFSDRSSSQSATRTEHKLWRRGSHGSGLHKLALSHARSSHAVGPTPKQSRSQNTERSCANLPILGSRNPDPIRRNRSQGAF